MITLDYEPYPEDFAEDTCPIEDFDSWSLDIRFEGRQIFVVNGQDFTTVIGIIGFASQLLSAVEALERGEKFVVRDWDDPWSLLLEPKASSVRFSYGVSEGAKQLGYQDKEALAPLTEFKKVAIEYARRVRDEYARNFPPLQKNSTFLAMFHRLPEENRPAEASN